MLEQVVFNQVSLFISQNNKLYANQSGFRSGHSIETALLSVTEALRIAKADSKSSVPILLDLSAAFDTVNNQILLSTLSSLDITGIPFRSFESYLTGRSFQVVLSNCYADDTQLYLSLSLGSCTDLRLPGGHLCMDERTSPTAQPGKDGASCLSCHSDSTAWFHHQARFFYKYPIKLSQKSWCNL